MARCPRVGWSGVRALPAGRRRGRRAVTILSDQDGREHFDRPGVQRPIIDHDLHAWSGELADSLGRQARADDDIHPSHQTTQTRPLGRARSDQHDVRQGSVRD
ncbi:MAG: hypothetical protein DMD80_01385, partial [Candidatus Rokuibacteriota bacterium]